MITLPLAPPVVNRAAAGNPRDSWPAWTDEEHWELGPEADPILDDEPRPTAGPAFEPAPEDDSERLGLRLGLDREDAAPPPGLAPGEARAFNAGLRAGRREWERRLDEMFADTAAAGRVTDFDVHPGGVC
jgi:hypothetical protein